MEREAIYSLFFSFILYSEPVRKRAFSKEDGAWEVFSGHNIKLLRISLRTIFNSAGGDFKRFKICHSNNLRNEKLLMSLGWSS
jgi:hypothetical protein